MSTITMPTTDFKTVLFASDFSPEAERALETVKAIVEGTKGEILLTHISQLHVVSTAEEAGWVDQSALIKAEEQQTEAATSILINQGFHAKAVCGYGPVGLRIAQVSELHHADVVVVGTHARKGLNRLLFGSYAEEIAGFLDIPLLIIGPRVPGNVRRTWSPKRILAVSAQNSDEDSLVAFAVKMASRHSALLDVVTLPLAEHSVPWKIFRGDVLELLSAEERPHLPATPIHLPTSDAELLTELMIARDADLVILAGRHREWLTLHAGLLQDLLAGAPCPVLSFPPRAPNKTGGRPREQQGLAANR